MSAPDKAGRLRSRHNVPQCRKGITLVSHSGHQDQPSRTFMPDLHAEISLQSWKARTLGPHSIACSARGLDKKLHSGAQAAPKKTISWISFQFVA
eukprot:605467-Rhodomonas_salina.1